MKRIFSKTGITLVELIVATVLVAVVLLGIFSISMVLNNNNQGYGQRYVIKSSTQTTLNHIINNASLAVGSGLSNDKGILIGTADGLADDNSFCIHQHPNNTSTDTTGDTWACYSLFNNQINYCTMPYNVGALARGAQSCTTGTNLTTGPTFLGTAYSISNYNGNSSPPSFYINGTNSGGPPMVFTITIQNCLDDTSSTGTCSPTGNSTDPANNPEVQLTESAFPLEEGMQNN